MAQGPDENPLLDFTGDTLAHLGDEQNAASECQEPSQSTEHNQDDFDNEKYLEEMEIDRNWQIPREKLEILEEKLGKGEFGIVCKGFYLRRDGSKLPVAVKTLRGLCSIFLFAEFITSNVIIDKMELPLLTTGISPRKLITMNRISSEKSTVQLVGRRVC